MDKYWDMVVFKTAVDRQSLSEAARQLDVTPSAVSKLVQRLEDRLGVRLITRTSRVVAPTLEGEIFYASATKILQDIHDAENEINSKAGHLKGSIRVHSLPSFAIRQIAPRVQRFLQEHPHIQLDITTSSDTPAITGGVYDIVIQSGPPLTENAYARKLGSWRWVICASPKYLQTHGTPRSFEDLASHNCLGFSIPTEWNNWRFNAAGEEQVYSPRGNVIANQGEMLLALARAGIGIVRHAQFHIAEELASGALVPILEDVHISNEETVYAIYHRHRNLSPRIRAFISFLQHCFSQER